MPSAELLKKPELNYEQWRDLVCPNFGLHRVDEPKAFAGRVHFRSIFGFRASEMRKNKCLCERTQRDIRLDGVDHCYAVFQGSKFAANSPKRSSGRRHPRDAPHKFNTVHRRALMLATSCRPARETVRPHRQAQERQAKCRADGFMQVLTMPRWRQAA
jgi:hypothetical protein